MKTIKLPKNLKQLNKGLLPEKNYEDDAPDAKETLNSQQIKQQKSSLTDCKAQERVNYESDVGLRDREDIHAKSPGRQQKELNRRAVQQARARRYRNASQQSASKAYESKEQNLVIDPESTMQTANDDVEPSKPHMARQ